MEEYNDQYYINKITEKIGSIEDQELKELVMRLVAERNNLMNVIKVDPLTGAYNRRIIKKIRDYSSVAMCDIDEFKKINDDLGHPTGDLALQLVAQVLESKCRDKDYVIRLGGDEFAIVFCGARKDAVKQRMREIAKNLEETQFKSGHKITLSVGIAHNYGDEPLEKVIDKADKALYSSKQNGRNRITSYDEMFFTEQPNYRVEESKSVHTI